MRRLILIVSSATLALGLAAGPALATSDNANQHACFGQGRADFATTGSETVGFYASMRKGDNASINAAYRDACQAAG